MLVVKIIIVVIVSVLFRLGGWDKAKWSGWRDVCIPLLLALWYWNWWLLLSYSTLRCGYGIADNTDSGSFLGRIFKTSGWTRGVWALLVTGIGALPLVLHTHLWHYYLGYVAINTMVAYFLADSEAGDYVIEPVMGMCIGAIVLLI